LPRPRLKLEGKRFGMLVAISGEYSNGVVYWTCICDCGKTTKVRASNLGHHTNSCGCYDKKRRIKHGLHKHPLYFTWANINRRCGTTDYGNCYLNVKVHPEWQTSLESFIKYVEENLGKRPTPQHSIDRISSEGDYVPGNIRWASKVVQGNNRKATKLHTYKGETETLRYFSLKYRIDYDCLRSRLWRGWTLCQALEKPFVKQAKVPIEKELVRSGKVQK